MADSSECKRNGSFAVMGTEQSDRYGRCSGGCGTFQCSDGCEDGKSHEPPMPGTPIACSLLSEERRASEEFTLYINEGAGLYNIKEYNTIEYTTEHCTGHSPHTTHEARSDCIAY